MLIGLNTGGSPRFTTSDLVIRGPGPTYITVREAEGKKNLQNKWQDIAAMASRKICGG